MDFPQGKKDGIPGRRPEEIPDADTITYGYASGPIQKYDDAEAHQLAEEARKNLNSGSKKVKKKALPKKSLPTRSTRKDVKDAEEPKKKKRTKVETESDEDESSSDSSDEEEVQEPEPKKTKRANLLRASRYICFFFPSI